MLTHARAYVLVEMLVSRISRPCITYVLAPFNKWYFYPSDRRYLIRRRIAKCFNLRTKHGRIQRGVTRHPRSWYICTLCNEAKGVGGRGGSSVRTKHAHYSYSQGTAGLQHHPQNRRGKGGKGRGGVALFQHGPSVDAAGFAPSGAAHMRRRAGRARPGRISGLGFFLSRLEPRSV